MFNHGVSIETRGRNNGCCVGQKAARTDAPQFTRLIVSSFVGTTLELFDFNIYTLLTPLVFNRLFFPQLDPAVATIASFSVFAVGLFSRPLGGIIFGHFGDRIGRKPTMVFTLLLIGVSTALMGSFPPTTRSGSGLRSS